jgi:glycosyltransferase involved in cell wall biosynthesis
MVIVQAIETGGPGGAESLMAQLASSLRTRGHEVRALLLRDGWLRQRLERDATPVDVLHLRRSVDRSFLRDLTTYLDRVGADVLHAHEFTLSSYGRLATGRLGIPSVATAHGANFARGAKRRVFGSVMFRKHEGFRLVAVSRVLAGLLSRRFVLPGTSLAVVPNGVPIPDAAPVPDRDVQGPLRLVAVGNLYPVKNHELLIGAVADLRAQGVDARLDILGRGVERERLDSRIRELNLADSVVLRGLRDDVPAFLERSHVFVSSSLQEGMPLSFLEAMARGLPVVASRVGGVPEIVTGEVGCLFESGDRQGLTRCLLDLARDERRRAAMGRAARRTVEADFSVERTVDAYERLYVDVCKSRA